MSGLRFAQFQSPGGACLLGCALALLAGSAACSPKNSPAPSLSAPPFHEMAAETGLKFEHFTGSSGQFYMPEIMGAGVALIDYDNDGDLDVYLVQGTMLDEGKKPEEARFPPAPGWKPGNRLFRNLFAETGKLQFTDVTEQAGVGVVGYGMGAAVGDYDNDGYPDLYVTSFGHNVLFHNNRNGTFSDVTRAAGVDDVRWSTSAAFFDYDGDGNLDLFVANYIDFTVAGNKKCFAPTGEPDYCTPNIYRPVPARLFHNLGNGRFEDVTQKAGVGSSLGPGLGVVADDFNGDGRIDVYVANDSAANLLWLNQGDGTFKEAAVASGVAYNADGLAQAGMGVTAADFDGDGDDDLLVTNLTREGCVLYRNDGKGNFYDATSELGLLQTTFAYTGFGTNWFDYDNDGRLDLFMANGAVTLIESLRGSPYPFNQLKLLFHNEGQGKQYRQVAKAGLARELSEVSRGAAFGDLDNDGAIDIMVTNNNGPVRLLHNETAARGHWLTVRLKAEGRNRLGIGARVAAVHAGGKRQWEHAHSDSSYLSANDPRVHFGLGETVDVQAIEVYWPDGLREAWENVQPDRILTLRRGTGRKQ